MKAGLWVLCLISVCLWTAAGARADGDESQRPGWKTYRSLDYGFTIDYPGDGSFTPGYALDPARSMIPVCWENTSVACFEYAGHAFDRTVIGSAGVSVNILRDQRTEAECDKIDDTPASTIVIHGTRFQSAETGGAAAGHSESSTVYRAFHQHVCFEIALVTTRVDVGPAEYEELGIHTVDENALRSVHNQMNQMLQSFVFTGRVRARGEWKTYHVSECGCSFQVPAGAEVQEQIPVAPPGSVNAALALVATCEQWFTDHDRVYAIAEKVDFRNQNQINDWLSLSAFPPLAQARKLSNGNLEWKSADRAYLVIRGQLFFFSVAGVGQQSPAIRNDPVFTHLVAGFRWP